jgi:YrbI family 3-deoxy-D-manno-octulosonate 8-phosphate phosphatase
VTTPLEARLKRIRLVAFDFDGVFTDNTVYVFEDGREAVRCSRGDGMGIGLLKRAGVDAVVISKERNPVVTARTNKLALRCIQGCDDKVTALKGLIDESGLTLDEVAFVGNDVNDIPCLSIVGLPIVVADSHPDVLPLGAYRTERPGGRGAVREICDMFVRARSRD